MPQNGFTIGRDVVINVNSGYGIIPLRGITGFRRRQEESQVKVKQLDGVITTLRFFEGWSGQFDLERKGPTVDRYFNLLEANYYLGLTESEVTIMETITEPDGSISQFLYRDVLLSLDDDGNFQGDTSVKMSLKFVASRRTGG